MLFSKHYMYFCPLNTFVRKGKDPDHRAGSGSLLLTSVADPDPGSGAFLTPESGIRNRFFPDPGSQDHIFKSF
jgi:hypothetical protein